MNIDCDNSNIEHICSLVDNNQRISIEQAVTLYNELPLFRLMDLAIEVKKRQSGDRVFYNKNFHIEPTNICKFNCKFCSYKKHLGEQEAWDMPLSEVEEYCKKHYEIGITEIHLVGAVHPSHSLEHYKNVISLIRKTVPKNVSIKAFSAIEHIEMINLANKTFEQGIKELIEAGMDSVTGGGAEIFDEEIREQICPDKASSKQWLDFHQAAHRAGIKTNSTMLYGHIENVYHRIEHLNRLRILQDETGGFLSFIPLKYRNKNNPMSHIEECSIIDDLKTLAISRIFLDNFTHIKAYWPMYGKLTTQLALLAGADDIDGTLKDTTKIYSMAGVDENALTQQQLVNMVESIGFKAIERDTFYKEL